MVVTANFARNDAALVEIIRRLVEVIRPERIILFGSRARGTARPDSDYDLLVIKATSNRTLDFEKAAYRAMRGVGVPVDIVVETPERLAWLQDADGLTYGDALREGQVVYG